MTDKDLFEIKSALGDLLTAQQEILNGFDFTSNVSIPFVKRLHDAVWKSLNNIGTSKDTA